MDESDNGSGSKDDQTVTDEEQLLITAAAADIEIRDLQLVTSLVGHAQKDELPLRTRKKC